MYEVASLGSINIDRMRNANPVELVSVASDREWFPEPGETVRRERCPEELIPDPDEVHIGGKGANQAAAASHAGVETRLFGKVGLEDEQYGVLKKIGEAGVDVDAVGRSDAGTGTAFVFIDESGESWIVVCAKANGEVNEAYVDAQYDRLREAEVVLLQNEIPLDTMEAFLARLETEDDPPTVVVDPSPTAGAARLFDYDPVEYVTPNEHEQAVLREELAAFDGTVLRTHGGQDLVVEGEEEFTVTPPTVDVRDTTGAGDVFTGFFAARLAAGASLRESAEMAVAAAALATREVGAQAAIPSLEEVERLRAESWPSAD
jgi:ribokinase